MRAAFFGTPAAAVPSLAALAQVADVELVVTRPDKPRGRSGRPHPSPVKVAAQQWGLRLAQPLRANELLDDLTELDVAVVTAYGQLLPGAVLACARRGFVNVHFSLLPRWRGAAPVQRALLAGDETGGVSMLVLDEGLDTGPIVAQLPTAIGSEETTGSLTARLASLGATLLVDRLGPFVADQVAAVAQDDSQATLAPKIRTEEARINFELPAEQVSRAIRAFNPRPGAWTEIDGDRFKILQAESPSSVPERLAPGELHHDGQMVLVGTGSEALALVTVQPQGKELMPGPAWARGIHGALPRLS